MNMWSHQDSGRKRNQSLKITNNCREERCVSYVEKTELTGNRQLSNRSQKIASNASIKNNAKRSGSLSVVLVEESTDNNLATAQSATKTNPDIGQWMSDNPGVIRDLGWPGCRKRDAALNKWFI